MNSSWIDFLTSQRALLDNNSPVTFAPCGEELRAVLCGVTHLAVLAVSGKDSAVFLQGQMTCNISDVTESQSRFSAMCNPNGRAIAVFIVVRVEDGFWLVLPNEQIQTVKAHLQKYILRAAVRLTDRGDSLCLIGEWSPQPESAQQLQTSQINGVTRLAFKNRHLLIAETEPAITAWLDSIHKGYKMEHTEFWQDADIKDGIPWLCSASAGDYIPQMLNLDRLGAISFSKGCYTGQEIVARTHYLGKAKRALFLGQCETLQAPEPQSEILDGLSKQSLGHVLTAHCHRGLCHLLMVLNLPETGDYLPTLPDTTPVSLTALDYD